MARTLCISYCMVASAIWQIIALHDVMAQVPLGPSDHGVKQCHYLPYMKRYECCLQTCGGQQVRDLDKSIT